MRTRKLLPGIRITEPQSTGYPCNGSGACYQMMTLDELHEHAELHRQCNDVADLTLGLQVQGR